MALAGCGGADASKEIETLQSWRATVDLTADARVRGWVTPRFADQLHDQGLEAASEGDKLTASSGITAAERDSLRAAGASLRTSLDRLERTGP